MRLLAETEFHMEDTIMPRAEWNGIVLAEAPTDQIQVVEGNIYFPPSAIKREYFQPSSDHSVCPWKGTASYYDVVVDGKENAGAAWYYPQPKDAAANIKDHVAFWRGINVES